VTGSDLKIILEALHVTVLETSEALGYSEGAVRKWIERDNIPSEVRPRLKKFLSQAIKTRQENQRVVLEILTRV